uniref:Uncharacterized protein LOC114333208 n=1 Tax=Diabrotica virgifera virgifera TaxID=50390 RepID=A0A6P7G2P0_DIAVI
MGKCLLCKKDAAEDKTYFKCDVSKRALHINCASITATEVRCLQLAADTRKLKYFCEDCEQGLLLVPILKSMVEDLKIEVEKLKCANEKSLHEKDNQICDLRKTIDELKCNYNAPGLPFEEMFIEINDRIVKSNNIMLFNVPELNSENIEDRIKQDRAKVEEIMKQMRKDEALEDLVKVVRVGRNTGSKSRPLRAIFSNNGVVKDILRNKKRLQNSTIKINSNQTNMQRGMFSKAFKELKDRQNKGEKDIAIKYRNGVPKIESFKKEGKS